jgi:hypothetical protein
MAGPSIVIQLAKSNGLVKSEQSSELKTSYETIKSYE